MTTMTEAEHYAAHPGNGGFRSASDWRVLLQVTTGLVIQVAHPTIGGGVGEHSTYKTDPYGRALRSIWPVLAMPILENAGYGADLREMHRGIGGIDHQGRKYHAWNAEAAFLVVMSVVYVTDQIGARFGQPLTDNERKEVFHAWRRAGLTFGIPESAVPATLAEYDKWLTDMVANTLEDHPTAHDVLASLRHPPAPPRVPRWLWRPAGELVGRVTTLVTLGTIPPGLREKLGFTWTAQQERKLQAFGRVVRLVDRILPRRLQNINGVVVEKFEQQIRGYIAKGADLGIAPSIAKNTTVQPMLEERPPASAD